MQGVPQEIYAAGLVEFTREVSQREQMNALVSLKLQREYEIEMILLGRVIACGDGIAMLKRAQVQMLRITRTSFYN